MIQHINYVVGRVSSGFCCEVDENCALLGYHVVSSGNFLPTCWYNLSVWSQGSRICQFQNISKELPILTA